MLFYGLWKVFGRQTLGKAFQEDEAKADMESFKVAAGFTWLNPW